MQKYYSLPASCSNFIERSSEHAKCSLQESIIQHIYLILSTPLTSHRFDDAYGCELLMYDFENLGKIDKIKPALEASIREILLRTEKRLDEVKVVINISSEDLLVGNFKRIRKIKKKITIVVTGKITLTNRPFTPPPFVIYLSPMTISGAK